jgi:hypothetical protein
LLTESHDSPSSAGLGALRVRVSGQRGWDLSAPPARAGPVTGFERTFGMDSDRHVTHFRAALPVPLSVHTSEGAVCAAKTSRMPQTHNVRPPSTGRVAWESPSAKGP